MTQAPSANLETSTTTRVTAVQTAPAALMAIDFMACGPPTLRQCATIPACDSVNARKAPTANNGIRLSVMPPKPIRSPADSVARTRMPREYTSRRPR